MRTDDLIHALGADAALKGPKLPARLALALALGAASSFLVFMAAIGPRPDFMSAMHTMRFDLKFIDTLALLAPAFLLCVRLARPQTRPGVLLAWLVAPLALLLAGAAVEMATVPPALWGVKAIGTNWPNCLSLVPTFALPPLAFLILALRHGAPAHPALTGALAGAAAAGVSATIYASNCTDDSPLFVLTWYPLATAFVAALGAAAGRLWLRW